MKIKGIWRLYRIKDGRMQYADLDVECLVWQTARSDSHSLDKINMVYMDENVNGLKDSKCD